jgi:hypothetical protein
MKFFLFVLFISVTIAELLKAQNETKIFPLPADTILRQQGITPSLELDYDFDHLFINSQLNPFESSTSFFDDTSTIWLRTELSLSQPFNPGNEVDKHFTSPLYDKYVEDSKFNLFRTVLGMAQLSAVGYLAYKHLKKYGFR